MKPQPYKGKERRKSSITKIRVSPFKLVVRPTKDGFAAEFTGVGDEGQKIEVELEFPHWWAREIFSKLDVFLVKRKP